MRGYLGTTDHEWFRFLRARQPLDEVNSGSHRLMASTRLRARPSFSS
jgi:hypothetical protein